MTREEKQLRQAKELLDRVLDWALANRGTSCEFVSCYTYHQSFPQTLADIKNFLGEPLGRKKIDVVKDRGVR